MDMYEYIMGTTYTAAAAWIHMHTSWILHTHQQQQHGYTWIHHGYYIHSSSSMDRHGYTMDTIYTSELAWIDMDASWILHTQQQQHGVTGILHRCYIHRSYSSIMDTHGYIMDTTYKSATAAAWIYMDISWILHTQQQQHGYTWIHHGYYIHSSSSMDTYGYIMDDAYTAVAAA
jgi:hypothetical protein